MAPFFIRKDIAINCWKEVPNIKDYVHFYTHVTNAAPATVELLAKIKPIYTSSFLAWYLLTNVGALNDAFVTVEFGVQHIIYKNGREITFEFLTSNSLQPSFMILFRSDEGDELFAGNCKFSSDTLSIRSMLPYLSFKSLNKLYFDGSYMHCPRIPSVHHIEQTIISTIKAHRKKIIYISANVLGNENILSTIAHAVNKKIHVSPEKYAVLTKLGIEKYFTKDPSTTYIRTIDYREISLRKMMNRNRLLGPSITIVLSLRAFLANEDHRGDFQENGIFFFPLTSLNTPLELQIMKRILTKEYVLTNLVCPVSNDSSGIDDITNHEKPNSSKTLKFRRYSKCKTYSSKVKKELIKCEPDFWMSWTDYLKWRRIKYSGNQTLLDCVK